MSDRRQGTLLNQVNEHVKNFMSETSKTLSGMQSSKIGTVNRSDSEQLALWDKLKTMEPQQRQSIMLMLASRAKHQGTQMDACEFCKFIAKHSGK
jgi:hypothetical protein